MQRNGSTVSYLVLLERELEPERPALSRPCHGEHGSEETKLPKQASSHLTRLGLEVLDIKGIDESCSLCSSLSQIDEGGVFKFLPLLMI